MNIYTATLQSVKCFDTYNILCLHNSHGKPFFVRDFRKVYSERDIGLALPYFWKLCDGNYYPRLCYIQEDK